MGIKRAFFLAFLFFSVSLGYGKEFRSAENLRPQWKVFKARELKDFDNKPSKVIHFSVDLMQARGHYLQIESTRNFYLFINSSLAAEGNRLMLSADSLRRKYPSSIFISIYQERGIHNLNTNWMTAVQSDALFNPARPNRFFYNFALTAGLILLILFTALFRTNPQLTLDYLNFIKLFFFKDRDENLITLRITSSVNLLFYLFSSLLASLALLTTAHFTSEGLSWLNRSLELNTLQYIGRWALLAIIIFGLLMLKLALASVFAWLFNWQELVGVQFFSFVRGLMLSLMFIAAVSIGYFSLGLDLDYFKMLKVGCFMLTFSIGLLYFKLLGRTGFLSFHLFSYLCGTEIFPLMVLIKVLLF